MFAIQQEYQFEPNIATVVMQILQVAPHCPEA